MSAVVGGGEAKQVELRGVLPAGTSLRGYELKSILGQGAFGITYRGRDLTLNRDVAIKEYLPTSLALREGRTTVLPRSPDHAEQFAWGRERFLDEARTLARLDKTPAIVRVHDFLEDNGTAYMVMALIEGETLNKRLLREQRLTPDGIERLLFPLLDGLEEVHAAGFLHRDIKPANIMVDARGRPTLIDFGASRAAMAEHSATMTAIFTPGYAAAEQFTSAKLGPWSDIYGLAATLYHSITGQIPPSAIERILNDSYDPLSELKPEGFSPALLAGIDAGMAVRAEDRPQNIAEWQQMLRPETSQSSGLEATRIARKPGPLARAARRTRRARITIGGPALWGMAAAAMLVVAGGGYLAYRAGAPATVNTATLNLTAEQLEQALAERRKADALAGEKRRLEDEARKQAESEAQIQQQAEAELRQAREARQKAEDDLAKLKASIETARQADSGQAGREAAAARRAAEEAAQHKAEAEAATLRQAEDEAQKKLAADAQAKRDADEALARAEAERQQADREAQLKTEAEAAALRQTSEEAQRKAADAVDKRQADEAHAKAKADAEKADAVTTENGLRLDPSDRKRVQIALTSLGFDTRGSDGILGPRSREMIAGWQQKIGAPAMGYLGATQRDQLLASAAPAVSRWDEEQKKAEEEAKAKAATSTAPPATSPPGSGSTSASDGTYSGETAADMAVIRRASLSLQMRNGRGFGTIDRTACETSRFSVLLSPTGSVSGDGYLNCVFGSGTDTMAAGPLTVSGTYRDGKFELSLGNNRSSFKATLNRGSSATPSPAAAPSPGPYDGSYVGQVGSLRSGMTVRISGGSGAGTIMVRGCDPSPLSLKISPAGDIEGQGDLNCVVQSGAYVLAGPASISGRADGRILSLTIITNRGDMPVTMRRSEGESLTAAASPPPAGPYDGQYSGQGDTAGTSGSASRSYISLRVANSRGSGTIDSPACSTSRFSIVVSPAGKASGEGYLNCVVTRVGHSMSGSFTVNGTYEAGSFKLGFSFSGGSFPAVLPAGAPTSSAAQSPN